MKDNFTQVFIENITLKMDIKQCDLFVSIKIKYCMHVIASFHSMLMCRIQVSVKCTEFIFTITDVNWRLQCLYDCI